MKKTFLLFSIVLLLFGCQATNEKKIEEEVKTILENYVSNVEIASINLSKSHYSYYLPEDMTIVNSNTLSSVLLKDGYKVILNFSPSAIIISEYYVDFEEDEENLEIEFKNYTEENLKGLIQENQLRLQDEVNTYNQQDTQKKVSVNYKINEKRNDNTIVYSGYYEGRDKHPYYYQLRLKRVNDTYYIHFDGTLLTLTSVVPTSEVDDIVFRMLSIAKSINYDKEKILQDFSLQYELEKMEKRFEEQHDYIYRNLPTEGYLEDLLNQEQWNND